MSKQKQDQKLAPKSIKSKNYKTKFKMLKDKQMINLRQFLTKRTINME